MSYDNNNSGVLFKEDKKNPKAPDYKGKLNVAGKDLEIAGWIRESKAGKKFLSLKVQEPRKREDKPKASLPPPGFDDEDSALPF